MDRYRIMTLVSLVFLSGLSPGLSSDLTTGKDRRTDGVALDFHSPPQHAGLFTGSATYSIPIDLPAAPGGHSPHLEIAYNSDRGNGWLGLGWDIAGLHRIERSTKYGVPSYMDPPSTEAFNTRHFDQFDLYLEGRHYEIFWDVNSKRYVTNPYAHFQITTKVSRKTVSQWTIVSKNGTKYVFEGIPAVGRPVSSPHNVCRFGEHNE